jgi:hypothetical protein
MWAAPAGAGSPATADQTTPFNDFPVLSCSELAALEPLALPLYKVCVLNRLTGWEAGSRHCCAVIKRQQVTNRDSAGPGVPRDFVCHQEQKMLLVTQPQQRGTKQRITGPVEFPADLGCREFLRLGLAPGFGQRTKVDRSNR